MNIREYYNDIFNTISEVVNDFETLQIGISILEIARDRLNNDLDDEKIKEEYNKLDKIIGELKDIEAHYV